MSTPPTPTRMGHLLAWVGSYAERFPGHIVATLGLMAFSILLNVAKPWPMVFLIDQVLRGRPAPPWLDSWLGFLPTRSPDALIGAVVAATILIFLLDWGTRLLLSYVSVTFGQRMTFALATDLFRHLQRLSLLFHVRRPTGDMIRRVTADCTSATTIFRDAFLPVIEASGSLFLMFFVMWQVSPSLTMIALLVLPMLIIVSRRYSEPMMARSYETSIAEGEIYSVVERVMASMPIVAAYQQEESGLAHYRAASSRVLAAALALLRVQLKFSILVGLATALGTALLFWLGGRAALEGTLTVGTIILFLSYLASLYAPLQTITQSGSTLQTAAGGARRVMEILATAPEVGENPGAPLLADVRGRVQFSGVSFAYEPGRAVLQKLDLTVEPGELVAIVGPTGAGKTTLVGLVPRFFDPTEGRVVIDGQDIARLNLRSVRAQVSVVLQESFLFPVSIAENIAYGRPDASRDEIERVARAANAHDFIAALPDGYESVVGERGATLSGGERQRVAIARALLKDAPILILDEPTSALDAATEAHLMDALATLISGRTTFVIAHRLSTVRKADKIVVLDRGRVEETGTHEELARAGGLYAVLSKLQFGDVA